MEEKIWVYGCDRWSSIERDSSKTGSEGRRDPFLDGRFCIRTVPLRVKLSRTRRRVERYNYKKNPPTMVNNSVREGPDLPKDSIDILELLNCGACCHYWLFEYLYSSVIVSTKVRVISL